MVCTSSLLPLCTTKSRWQQGATDRPPDTLEVKSLVNVLATPRQVEHRRIHSHDTSQCCCTTTLTIVRSREQQKFKFRGTRRSGLLVSPPVNAHPPVDRGGLNALNFYPTLTLTHERLPFWPSLLLSLKWYFIFGNNWKWGVRLKMRRYDSGAWSEGSSTPNPASPWHTLLARGSTFSDSKFWSCLLIVIQKCMINLSPSLTPRVMWKISVWINLPQQ